MRIDIKHIAKYLISCALLCSALVLHARVFEAGERLYFNGTPPNFNTWKNDAELWVQLKNGGSDWWLKAQWKGEIPYVEINSDCARDWTHVVLARCQPGNRYYVYHQTGDLTIDSYKNYIYNFTNHADWSVWATYIPAPEGDPSTWTYEDEEICTSAAGSKYELTPINREYTDKTQNSSWFEYNGSSWKNLHGTNVWTQPGERNYNITLGAAGYDKYFFFQCSTPSKCRLIRIRLNQDCSPGAPGACKITSFIAVASDANVTDSTCAVDGLVAFDDKVNAGDLKVWCDDVDTVIFANGSVETPQTFKLKGFDAKATKSYTLHAKFLNGNSECEDVCYVIVSPPSVEPTIWNNTRTGAEGSHDRDLIRFTCEDVTLTPRNQDSKYFQWTNSDDDTKITGAKPENRNTTFTAPTEEKDIEYVFMATNEPPAPEGNLISNGTFEDPDKDTYLESNYNRWGRGNTDFYTGGNAGKSGGYAITDNAKTFWHDYQDITAHEGTYFGLFDSKIYDGTEQAAWIARSGSKNPNLKVQKGVSYLFSFWVANINAYDQMNNGARLQFQISYNGGSTWTNLGDEINLKNFKDHNWHGRSSIATPDETSENVVIRVINLNQSDQNIGNDFALDDIRFEAVTSHSSNIAAYERFPVKYLKCEITGATFEQPLSCDVTKADVNYTITFVHPRGDLYIFEKNADETLTPLTHILHSDIGDETTSYTGVLKDQPVDNKNHDLIVYFDDGNVCSKDPKSYSYYSHATPTISIESLTWGTVSCDIPTVPLTAVINYTNQNGTLTAKADGIDAYPVPTYTSIESDTPDQVTLTFPGLTADGKTDHKLFVNFDGAHGCSINYDIPEHAPYMPKIISTAAEVQPNKCGDEKYKVKITVNYTNSQDSDLVITDEAGNEKILKAAEYGATEASYTFEMPWEYPVSEHTFKAFFVGAQQCKDEPSHLCTYTAPAKPTISAVSSFEGMECDKTTYTLQLKLTYTNQKGSKFYASVDGGTPVEVANPNPGAQTEKSDVTINVTGLLGDGKEDHTYRIWTDNTTEDCELSIPYKAPFAPVISNIEATPKQMACDITKYDVVVTFDVTNGQDSLVTVWGKADKHETFVAVEGKNTVTFEGIETDTEKDYFDIWFENANNCNHKRTIEYKEPVTPYIYISQGPSTGETDCNKTTYTVKFDVTYINQRGKLYGWIDDGAKTEFSYKENQSTEEKVTICFTDVIGDGLAHTLHAEFDGGNSCSLEIPHFNAPYTPVITKVSASVMPYVCGASNYQVKVTVDYSNSQDHDLIITDEEGHEKTLNATDPEYGTTSANWVFDLPWESPIKEHTFKAFFDGEVACKNEDSHKDTYIAPEQPILAGDTAASYCYNTAFVWHGVPYKKDDSPTYPYKSILYPECDSIVTLRLTELPELTGDTTVTITKGSTFPWHGGNYTEDDTPTHTYTSKVAPYCDSIVTLHVHEVEALVGDTTAYYCYGEAFEWYGVNYHVGDNPTHKYTSMVPPYLDSIVTLVLIERPNLATDTAASYCNGGHFEWYGTAYTIHDTPPTKIFTSTQFPECDSIVTLRLTELPLLTGDTTVTITKGSTFPWHGGNYNEANTPATHTYTSKVAPYCDSIVTLHVHEVEALVGDTTAYYCYDEAFEWYGVNYHVGDNPTHKYTSLVPPYLDSIVTLVLIERPNLATDTAASYCYGGHFKWYGTEYTIHDTPPTKTFTSTQFPECDSIVTLRLTELPLLTGDTTVTITKGSTFPWHGGNYTEDDTPTHTYTSKVAPYCDSIVTLHVHEVEALVGDTTAYYCYGEAFEWYGVNYHVGDNPTHKYTSLVPPYLDSIVTLVLIERPNLATDTAASYCYGGHFEWYGTAYTIHDTPPTKIFTSTQFPECDSIVTLRLTELPELTGDTTVTITKGSTFPWHGGNYNEANTPATHTYTSKVAPYCDSIVTLHVHEVEALVGDTTAYYCYGEAFEWYGVNYHVGDNPTHKYTSLVPPYLDSIVTLVLIERPNLATDTVASYCYGGHFKWYGTAYTIHDTPPTKTFTSTQFPECDSIVTLRLTEIHLTATASVLPYACGDRTYSVNVEVDIANGTGRDLIIEDWKGNIAQIPTTSTDTKKEYTFTYEKHTPGGRHGYEVYLDGNADCAVYAYYIEPAQPKIDNIQHSATDVTDCNSNVYDLIVTFDYYNQDGTLSVDLDGRPADDITPAFVPDVFDKQTAKATFIGLTADGLEHTLTVKTIGGTHNCQKSIAVNAPERLSCIKDYAQTCEGEIYTWPRTGLDYGPFTHAGIDTIVNTLNVLDTLIVSVYPTYNMPAEEVSIIDGETYTWHGKEYETEGVYSETLETVNKCDSIVYLNLTVQENIVENVAFSIAEQCAGEGALEIAIQHTGYLTDARLSFSEDAIRAGFENGTYPIEDDIVTIPYNVKAGIFSVGIDLFFHSRLKHSGNEPFTLLFPSTVLEQGWMDAIFVLTHDYNGGYDFTDFQWYKKGHKLVGETGPYLYQPLEVGAEYSAMLTEKSGLQLMTCPLIITEHTDISLYPTIVTRKQMICVSVTQNAHLTMYSLMGEKVSTYSLVHGDTQISAPSTQGIYLVEVVLESGQRKVIKIMVR